jgi:hypothetical protein
MLGAHAGRSSFAPRPEAPHPPRDPRPTARARPASSASECHEPNAVRRIRESISTRARPLKSMRETVEDRR